MKLKTVVSSLDGLSEEIAKLYSKSGDVFILALDGLDEHPDVKGLSNTVKAVRTEKKTLEEQLAELGKKIAGIDLEKVKDIDPEKYQEHLAELQRLKDEEDQRQKQKLKDEQKWEKLEQQLLQDHETKIQSLTETYTSQIETLKTSSQAEKEKLMGALKTTLKDQELTTAFIKVGANIPVMTPHVAPLVDVRDIGDGTFRAVVIDPEGNPRKDDKGTASHVLSHLWVSLERNRSSADYSRLTRSRAVQVQAETEAPPTTANRTRLRKNLSTSPSKLFLKAKIHRNMKGLKKPLWERINNYVQRKSKN
jgi:hypothetical protein